MAVENASTIPEFDEALPSGQDGKSEGDNHIRLMKTVLKATFAGITGVASQADASVLTGHSNAKLLTVLRGWQQITARIATQVIAEGGADDERLMTSLKSKQQIDARLVDQTGAEGGAENTKLMTSLRAKQQIDARIATEGEATGLTNAVKLTSVLRAAQTAFVVFDQRYTEKIATVQQALDGANNTTTSTPLRVRQHGDQRYVLLDNTTSLTRQILAQPAASQVRTLLELGNSATLNTTSSAGSTSTSLVATAAAVKTAYDRGTEGINAAQSGDITKLGAVTVGWNIGGTLNRGNNIAGSSIRVRSSGTGPFVFQATSQSGDTTFIPGTVTLPGTWRCITYAQGRVWSSGTGLTNFYPALFVRIA